MISYKVLTQCAISFHDIARFFPLIIVVCSNNLRNKNVTLLCPTCGNSDLEIIHGSEETVELVRCPSCGRELTKDELIKENSENIDMNLTEVKNEITKDVAKEMQKMLKDVFKGNKNIKFR